MGKCAVFVSLVFLSTLQAVRAEDDFQKRVDAAIEKGAAYLAKNFNKNDLVPDENQSPTLPLYALIHAGRKEDQPLIEQNLKELLRDIKHPKEEFKGNYTWSVAAMAYALANAPKYASEMDQIKSYLLKGQDALGGWGYNQGMSGESDNTSVTQFVLLGLHACWRKDHPKGTETVMSVPNAVWEKAARYWLEAQQPDGGWGYGHPKSPFKGAMFPNGSYPNMTCAGISSLSIVRAHLQEDALKEKVTKAIEQGVKWLDDRFSKEKTIFIKPHTIGGFLGGQGAGTHAGYYLYSLEKAADMAGLQKIGGLDWYRVGAEHLLKTQKADGSWTSPELIDPKMKDKSLVTTSFAILFLKRASGIIITGDKHGDWKGIDTQGPAPEKKEEKKEE